MKGRTLLVLAALGLIGWWYFANGGDVTATNPNQKIPLPKATLNPNNAADAADKAGRTGSDYVAGLSPTFWKFVVIGLLVAAAVWLWSKPAVRYCLIGAAGLFLVLFATGVL